MVVVFVETLGVCGSKRGHRGKIGESMRKWAWGMELLLLGAGRPGQLPDVWYAICLVDTTDVRAPGSGTNTMNSTGKSQLWGKIRTNLWMEIVGEMGKS